MKTSSKTTGRRIACWLAFLACAPASAATVTDFAAPDTATTITAAHATRGAAAGKLLAWTFQPAPAPALTVTPKQGTWQWSQDGELDLTLQNRMAWAVTLQVTVTDVTGGTLQATVGVPAGPIMRLAVPLATTSPLAFGMQFAPPMPFTLDGHAVLVATTVTGHINAARVRSVALSVPNPQAPQTLAFGAVSTSAGTPDLRAAYTSIVDRYGQFTRDSWPEKIDRDAALRVASPAAKPAAATDRYGGRLDVQLAKTGWFHTQQARGRWWLVTPDGHGFFSLGVNAIDVAEGRTYVTGRTWMFAGLPSATDAWAAFYGRGDDRAADQQAGAGRCCDHGTWFNFYAANLYRRDGADWPAAWQQRTLARLKGWGFNTIGNWSEATLGAAHQLPYTRGLDIHGDFGNVATGFDWWGRTPDPFDPRFAAAANAAAAHASRGVQDDPWLLGYFADNELAWAAPGPQGRWALPRGTLAGQPASAAKRAFIADLKQRYATPAKLAAAWGIPLASWAALDAEGFRAPPTSEAHPAITRDYSAWLARYAEQYFRTVAEAIHRHDPRHLFLGSRFAAATPEAITACAKWCDVMSFNSYADVPAHGFDAPLAARLNRPVLIGEFGFGSSDRGPFGPGVVPLWNEAQRGQAYARYVAAARANPVIVGAHWFAWLDQPAAGRLLDGENRHVGLVGVTDIPFAEFIDQVRATNRERPRLPATRAHSVSSK